MFKPTHSSCALSIQMNVMIMDTQGLFDFQTPEVMNKTMLTLTTLLSSVQIFNALQQINTQHLSHLKVRDSFCYLFSYFRVYLLQ